MTPPVTTAERHGLPLAEDCCTPLLREPLTPGQAADLARTLKALADPTRLRLVSMVAARDGREACVCELTEPLGLTQPTISHHLKILVDAGIFSRDNAACGPTTRCARKRSSPWPPSCTTPARSRPAKTASPSSRSRR